MEVVDDRIDELLTRLDRIEAALQALVERQQVKAFYSTEEVGKILGLSEGLVKVAYARRAKAMAWFVDNLTQSGWLNRYAIWVS